MLIHKGLMKHIWMNLTWRIYFKSQSQIKFHSTFFKFPAIYQISKQQNV